jgi:hypothetical protein
MAYLGAADIAAMLADLDAAEGAVEVTLGSNTVNGLRDEEAVELLGGEMPAIVAADLIVHVASGSLPGLASKSSVVVDGSSYKILKVMPYGDGAMTRIALRQP